MKLWCTILIGLIVLEAGVQSKKKSKTRSKKKSMAGFSVESELADLRENVSALWSEMNGFGSSSPPVMVHVHGMGNDDTDTHRDGDGTHVHIHMHMDDGHHGHPRRHEEYTYARCDVMMNPNVPKTPHNIQGTIFFRQKGHEQLEMILHLAGFSVPSGDHDHSGHADHMGHSHHTDHSGKEGHLHGFHVHQYGDFSNGCNSFGGHFNPGNVDHSSHGNAVRHAGDWGNIECDLKGEVHHDMNDTSTSLIGDNAIIGRGIVIHESKDDMGMGGDAGSLATGNAGARIACCTIAFTADLDWAKLQEHHDHEH